MRRSKPVMPITLGTRLIGDVVVHLAGELWEQWVRAGRVVAHRSAAREAADSMKQAPLRGLRCFREAAQAELRRMHTLGRHANDPNSWERQVPSARDTA